MDKPLSRPTFIRTLRRISLLSIVITMTLIWLLLCVASVFTLQQYAQKNLEFTGVTMSHSLEAALVFDDEAAAASILKTLGEQGHYSAAEVLDKNHRLQAAWDWSPDENHSQRNGCLSRL